MAGVEFLDNPAAEWHPVLWWLSGAPFLSLCVPLKPDDITHRPFLSLAVLRHLGLTNVFK